MAGGLEHFCPCSGLSSVGQFSRFLEGSMLFRTALWDCYCCCCFFLRGEGGGGTPVTTVQFPAQLRNIHNKTGIASPKQSRGEI